MKTKVLPVILSLVMLIAIGPKSKLDVSAVNVKGSMVDEQGVAFTLYDDGTATVLGPIDRPAYGTKFVIPAEINGYRVTEIADKAFDIGCRFVKHMLHHQTNNLSKQSEEISNREGV